MQRTDVSIPLQRHCRAVQIPMFDLRNRSTGIATLEGKTTAEGATGTTQKAEGPQRRDERQEDQHPTHQLWVAQIVQPALNPFPQVRAEGHVEPWSSGTTCVLGEHNENFFDRVLRERVHDLGRHVHSNRCDVILNRAELLQELRLQSEVQALGRAVHSCNSLAGRTS